MPLPNPFPYKLPPFPHQRDALRASVKRKAFALLMEQGTGKTMVAICTAAALWWLDEIDGLLVVAPNNVHTNWALDEIPKHMPDGIPYRTIHWRTGKMMKQKAQTRAILQDFTSLAVLCMNIDAISTDQGKRLAHAFLRRRRAMMVIDESDDIKTPGAERTRIARWLGKFARYRRICTGTPGQPLDLYAQFAFLDPNILGARTFKQFKETYAEWREIEIGSRQKIELGEMDATFAASIGLSLEELAERLDGKRRMVLVQERNERGEKIYKNLDQLKARMYTAAFRVTKADVFADLPPKLFQKCYAGLNAEQRRMYNELVRHSVTAYRDGKLVTADLVLTQYLRLQQIVCGYVPTDDAAEDEPTRIIDGPNYRLDTLERVLKTFGDARVIIWARFRLDHQLIAERLRNMGWSFVQYTGEQTDDEKLHARRAFQDGNAQVFLGNQKAGGRGLTLTAASHVVMYSNYFGYITRLQSEDRAHRHGQHNAVTIWDMVAEGTIDERILRALRTERNVADTITGDNPFVAA